MLKDKLSNNLLKLYGIALSLITLIMIGLYGYTAFYARPTGDDLGYAKYTHSAWVADKSLINVFKASLFTVENNYKYNEGSYIQSFISSLMPEVFKPWTFWLAIWGIIAILVISSILSVKEICHKRLGIPVFSCIVIFCTYIFLFLQHMPSTSSGMYWLAGSSHYILPFSLMLWTFSLVSKFINTHNAKHIVGLSILAFIIGGDGYFAALYLFILYPITILICYRRTNKKSFLLSIPWIINTISLIIVIKSPGMRVGRTNEGIIFSFEYAIDTICESIRRSAEYIVHWHKDCVFLLPCEIMLALVLLFSTKWNNTNFEYRFPFLFVIMAYLLYAAMYSPWVYSERFDTRGASKGPINFCFITYLATMIAIVIYISGYINKKVNIASQRVKSVTILTGCAFAGLFLIINRHDIFSSHGYAGYEYIVSGQAEDYRNQCIKNMEMLLDPDTTDVVLIETNSYQGLLCNMVATDDPNDFTSYVYADFYGKNSVVMYSNQ